MKGNFSLIGFSNKTNGVRLALYEKSNNVLCLMTIESCGGNHYASMKYNLFSGDNAIEAFQKIKYDLDKIAKWQPWVTLEYNEDDVNKKVLNKPIYKEVDEGYDLSNILTINNSLPVMLIADCDLYDGPIEEEKVHVIGFTIKALERKFDVYVLNCDSRVYCIKYKLDLDNLGNVAYCGTNYNLPANKYYGSIVMKDSFHDMKKVEMTIPGARDFTPLYELNLFGINLKDTTIDGDVWTIDENNMNIRCSRPTIIKTGSIKQEGILLETESIDELREENEKLKKALNEAQDVIREQINEINRVMNQNMKIRNEINKFMNSIYEKNIFN